jgi:glycosyltransferase involved in cell wall biosynthesis
MKVLIYGELGVGGTAVNSIELAVALRDLHGFDVAMFATPGPLAKLAEEKGLRIIEAPYARYFPSLTRIRALRNAVRSERPDLLHVWDWFQTMDAYYGVFLPMRLPLLITDMTMEVTRVLPKKLVTTFGTPELVEEAKMKGRRHVELLLPPVDVRLNAPGSVDAMQVREMCGIEAGDITIVTVSRLDTYLKRESLYRTLDVVRTLGRELPIKFVIVGDGEERPRLERLAGEINSELNRRAVVFTGFMVDPRPAYAAADIVVGMGGSSLRGMAFEKAVVIVGDRGFSAPFTPDTAQMFYYRGMYGRGDGSPSNEALKAAVRQFAERPDFRTQVGRFSREFVVREFSLEKGAERLARYCYQAAASGLVMKDSMSDGLRTAAVYLRERRFLITGSQPRVFMSPNSSS